MTRLTLAMIVRDEARRLPGFLAHHAPLADEIVVVDTGSADGSADLARAAGALVRAHPWREDFAAARNAALAASHGDHVLILDADERVAARDFDRLRAAAAGETVWLLETRNYLPAATHLEWLPLTGAYPREEAGAAGWFAARRASLFPRRPDLRFTGRIHESVLPAAAAAGLPVATLDVPIHHHGHLGGAGVDARRRARDRALARRKLEEAPDDPAALLEWGTLLLEDGDAEAAAGPLRRAAAGAPGLRPVVRAKVLLGRLERERGRAEAAGELLEAAVQEDPAFPFAWVELVRCHADRGAWGKATDLVARALACCGDDHPLLLRERLRCRVHTGQLAGAAADAAALAGRHPQWTEIVALQRRLERLAGGS